MSEPMFCQHPFGLHLSVTGTPTGYMPFAYKPETGRAVYGLEETEYARSSGLKVLGLFSVMRRAARERH